MLSYFANMMDAVKRSLWVLPSLMALGGLGLAISLHYLDWLFWGKNTPYIGERWGVNFEGVRALFTSVSAAIITAMTTILSITLLIFTVLGGQYGAHVLRVFKIRAFSKFVIGWFSAAYVYIIYHIYAYTTNDEREYVPQLSITLGAILTLSTIFLLIAYIHFLVRQIQISTVVAEVSSELCKKIRSLDLWGSKEDRDENTFPSQKMSETVNKIALNVSGYVQSIDKKKLRNLATKNNCVIKINHRSGDFVVTGETALIVYTDNNVNEDFRDTLRSCFIVGEKRLPVDDLEYDLEILTEMILRALSPGINDIIIANNCIDHLGESLALLVKRRFPKNHVHDEDGKLLLIAKEFSFEGYMNAALNPIRQYSSEHCSVIIRLMDNLIKATKLNECDAYQRVINRHFLAIHALAVEKHRQQLDHASIDERYQNFLSCTTAFQ